ncbi:winged helix-turn-helix transcriptional regulator [Cryptosporangium phraense]|uniref:Helix-turn-helix transcriptional regulator n=1 Tax=Cryptosporangium phraense TaxID=2593070 RepID=A0A545AU24_9ACTN|nr:helix-turn-helix domain-containing protein [Cryptosporangium phraense]TQS44095.1 helix-turn-helix transcriptional regulator [Cryptosporangium phraense]
MASIDRGSCTIGRVLNAIGDKWSLRLLCEAALNGVERFSDFQAILGVAPDVLGQRLNKLVEEGLLVKQPYREPGQRTRFLYTLTPAARELRLALAALQQWGEVHRPAGGVVLTEVGRTMGSDRAVQVAFVDDVGDVVDPEKIEYRYSV